MRDDADLTLAFVSDIHVGPAAMFDGKLRKLTHRSLELLRTFVDEMNTLGPDVVVNLGDDIEDESEELDRARLRDVMDALGGFRGELLHVAGNHDTKYVDDAALLALWRTTKFDQLSAPPLRYALERKGFHLVVLHTHEIKDDKVFLANDDLVWLDAELARSALPKVVMMHHAAADQVLRGNRWFERAPHLCLVRERRRLREILKGHDVRLVVNGHLHWNHLAVIDGVPFVTVQSLVENLDDDLPGRPARGHLIATLTASRTIVDVRGEEPARYQFSRD